MTLAEARGLVVEHRGATLVGPVDIAIRRGEFWGVVGPNGAGKSSLLRAVAGLEPIGGGTLELAGAAGRRNIGHLFQHHDFVPELPLTVEDVVNAGRSGRVTFGSLRGSDHRRAVADALDLLGIGSM